ncbi:MAG: hypothetical protein ACE5FK_06765, partial [Candidatus Methylomirabilia bacterium]
MNTRSEKEGQAVAKFAALTAIVLSLILLGGSIGFAWAQQAPAAAEQPAVQEASDQGSPGIDSGDTAWLLTSSALVLLMTVPGLALFYAGMVRQKNALGAIMYCFITVALISVQWVLWGYSLAFGP